MNPAASPAWSNRPPAPTEFAGLRLVRVQAGRSLTGIVTSDELTGCYTHYTRRRTIPCTGPDCPYCEECGPPRWHGYISVTSPSNRAQAVLELTALAAVPLADYADRVGTLRGARIEATRGGNRANGPVTCTIAATDTDHRTLPRPVDLKRFLSLLWDTPDAREATELDPPRGQNIRNTPVAAPSGSPTQPEKSHSSRRANP